MGKHKLYTAANIIAQQKSTPLIIIQYKKKNEHSFVFGVWHEQSVRIYEVQPVLSDRFYK